MESSVIVSFNVKDDKLDSIRCINHDWSIPEGIYYIGIIDESLALLYWSYDRRDLEIEVMIDYGVQDSWSLRYKLDPTDGWLEDCCNSSVMTSFQKSLYYDTNDIKTMKKLISLPENSRFSGFSKFSLPLLQCK